MLILKKIYYPLVVLIFILNFGPKIVIAVTQSNSVDINAGIAAGSGGPIGGGGGGGGGGAVTPPSTPPDTTPPTPPPVTTPPDTTPPTTPPVTTPPDTTTTTPTQTPSTSIQTGGSSGGGTTSNPPFITITPDIAPTTTDTGTEYTFNTDTTTFKGTSNLKNSPLTINISGPTSIQDTITTDSNGQWSWQSPQKLENGTYTITTEVKDSIAPELKAEKTLNFNVAKEKSETIIPEQITDPINNIALKLDNLKNQKNIVKSVNEVTTPLATASAITGVSALIGAQAAANAGMALQIEYIANVISNFRFYLLGLFRFKKRKPWGKVVYKHTGKPVIGATIQIYDNEFNKLKDNQFTDTAGRFSALVSVGTFFVKVTKKGFKSIKSEVITITDPNQTLELEFALEALEGSEPENKLFIETIFKFFGKTLVKASPYILFLGNIISVINVFAVPSTLNHVILLAYISIDLLQLHFLRITAKPFGSVINPITNKPLSLAIIRIFNSQNNTLLATKVTDEKGRFNFLVHAGTYYITASKTGFKSYHSEELIIKRSDLLAKTINLTPEEGSLSS